MTQIDSNFSLGGIMTEQEYIDIQESTTLLGIRSLQNKIKKKE